MRANTSKEDWMWQRGVRRPKGEDEGYPEVPVTESPDELTLRADEVGTWKSCISVEHIAKGR